MHIVVRHSERGNMDWGSDYTFTSRREQVQIGKGMYEIHTVQGTTKVYMVGKVGRHEVTDADHMQRVLSKGIGEYNV